MARFLLADGSSQIYRTWHALARTGPTLTAPDGTPTGAVLSFLNVLRRAIRVHSPTHVAVTFDRREPTFRHERFPAYKAQRDAAPEDLVTQLVLAREALAALCIPVVEEAGWEADDVIATLTQRAVELGHDVVILSSDKDLLQLVGPRVLLHHALRDEVMDEAAAEAYFGAPPRRVPDVLTIMGDTSDNIQGVKGIGDKGARQLVSAYGDIDNILRSVDAIAADESLGRLRKRMAALLTEHAESARLALELVTLRRDVPLRADLDSLVQCQPDAAATTALFSRLGFTKLLQDLQLQEVRQGPSLTDAATAASSWRTVHDTSRAAALAESVRGAGAVAVATDRRGPPTSRGVLAGLALSHAASQADHVPADLLLRRHPSVASLHAVLSDPAIPKSGHDLKRSIKTLAGCGVKLEGASFDVQIASYLIDPSRRRHDLATLAADHLGYRLLTVPPPEKPPAAEPTAGDRELPELGDEDTPDDAGPSDEATAAIPSPEPTAGGDPARRCAEQADVAFRLRQALEPKVRSSALGRILDEIEMPLVPILAEMELTGVRVDTATLKALRTEMDSRLSELTIDCFRHAGREFNISSPKQLAEVLFDELGLQPRARTSKTGARSTAVEVLEQLAEEHPLCRSVLDHRELSKLVGTYVDVLPRLVDPVTGRVHTTYHQAVAETGRLSSSDPNLQNIPMRSELGRRIRKAFVAEPGHVLAGADYSQVELRIMAHLSQDDALCEAFANKEDIHRATAAKMFGVMHDLVTVEMRNRAKVINFGLLYGMTAHGVATRLGCSRQEASQLIEGYFGAYPRMRGTIDRLIEEARTNPRYEASTLFGRTRPLPEIVSRNGNRRAFAERAAVNTVVQGTAADIMKMAMIEVHRRLKETHPRARLILQVHDELVAEVHQEEADAALKVMCQAMESVYDLRAPLEAVGHVGATWYDLK